MRKLRGPDSARAHRNRANGDSDEDPAIETFLGFLAADIKAHPQAIKALSPDLAARIASLAGDMTINLDDEIDGDVAL